MMTVSAGAAKLPPVAVGEHVTSLSQYASSINSWTTMSTAQQPTALGRGEEAGNPPATNVRPQRGSITSLLILSLIFLMMTNNSGGDDLATRNQYKDSLSSLEWQLGNYSAWLNGSDTTNFTLVCCTPRKLFPCRF